MRSMSTDMRTLTADVLPERLKEIPDAPETLHLRGTLPPEEYAWLAVVGSRKASSYGKRVCQTLIQELAGTNTVIVSGLAIGMDGIAHAAALEAGLPTVAVPGSGLSDTVLYPSMHRELARRILKADGALLSEFPPDHKPHPHNFPQRNRIMAGLSDAVLVVEAAERSGSLITARLATDYNRDVLAVPGDVFSSTASGTNRLISDGAVPALDAHAICETLGIALPDSGNRAGRTEPLSENEEQVLALLDTPLPRDEVIASLSVQTHEANTLLAAMELKGIIGESLGKLHRT